MSTEPTLLELFASDEQLAELEQRHAEAPLLPVPAMALAWALRQRDPERCLDLARAAVQTDPALLPRLWLIEGERIAATGERLDDAQALCERARAAFAAAGDGAVGGTDVCLLAAIVAREHNAANDIGPLLGEALAEAARAGEAGRMAYCGAALARHNIWAKGPDAEAQCLALLPSLDTSGLHPAVASQLSAYLGYRAAHRGDNPGVLRHFSEAHDQCLRAGQGQFAIVLASNLALMHGEGGETALALQWGQTALSLSRKIWPARLGECLSTNAIALRRLGQLQEARDMAEESAALESNRPESRFGVHAQIELGLIDFANGQDEAALARLSAAVGHPALQQSRRFLLMVECTEILQRLGRHVEAEASVSEALRIDEKLTMPMHRVRARALLADAWLAQGRVEQAQQAYAALLAHCATLPDFKPWPSTLRGAARAYAAAGLHAEAFELGERASDTLEQRFSTQAEQRSRALYTQFRTERAQLEADHLRSLAQASAERLAGLERSHSVLDQLGTIGRELTTQLDAGRALEVLAQHVQSLLPVDCLMVYLLDASGRTLECALCEDQGETVQGAPLALDDLVSLTARCARERQVLLLQEEDPSKLGGVRLSANACKKRSLLFAPLSIGTRLVGVMSVQSSQTEAFGPEPQLIFGTLCAYAAIALDNARAYQQLTQMQRQLRAQERMASLGFMVTGIAHELNTPLGNALLAVTTLKERTAEFERRLAEGALRKSDWTDYASAQQQGHALIQGGVDTASRLVKNFRQIAQRRDAEQRKRFPLARQCEQALLVRAGQAQRGGHVIEVEVPDGLELDSYAYALDQALDILAGNALLHGLADRPGTIRLRASRINGEHCRLELSDDGRGMSAEVLPRIFEPFFTTTLGKGGSGLGLSICHSLVEDVLGGRVEAFSEPGRGSRFVIELPLSAP